MRDDYNIQVSIDLGNTDGLTASIIDLADESIVFEQQNIDPENLTVSFVRQHAGEFSINIILS